MLLALAAVGFVPPTAGPPRSCSRGASAIACSSAQPEPDPAHLRASLDRLFTLSVDPDDDAGKAGAAQLEGELIRDLPLWRVQWPASPACSQVYNVHVPHYTHMFSTVDAASRADGVPGLFGHLLLPGGSASLGDPAFALEPGSQAPLVGVVMQLIEVEPLADGRLQVTAAGLCRFEVVRATQTTPYSRADVRPLPDDDEVAAFSDRASRALARVRAAAEALEWASQEVEEQEARRAAELEEQEARRAAELVGAAELYEELLGELPAGEGDGDASGDDDDEDDDDDDVLASPAALARAQAKRAERLAASVDALRGGALLALEQQLWCELIRCLSLTRALRSPYATEATTAPVSLPQALAQLIPPPPAEGWPAGAPAARPAAEAEWMARYPPYRRAQRLSYAVATLTPEVDRQALLLAPSTMARLMLMSEFLAEARKRLEVAMALRVAGMDGSGDGGQD